MGFLTLVVAVSAPVAGMVSCVGLIGGGGGVGSCAVVPVAGDGVFNEFVELVVCDGHGGVLRGCCISVALFAGACRVWSWWKRRACGGGGYACLADMVKEVAAVDGVPDHETFFQRRLKAGGVERLVGS